ncbi:MAG TPA: SsrA-binding protein SmpB [Methylomirabilota bacterium]|jgi:SsrA-binding protein|nr:SsrA-binding protein SmpB [Methylomirabilota bacterium]
MAVIEKLVASNRKAHHNFEILETYEAGLVLRGTEVKALREGRADLKESYARVEGNEAWLLGCHISPYAQGNRANHDPLRPRKLLLHRAEINRLLGKIMEKGLTLVPLRLYFKDGRVKVEVGLARGRKTLDKRHVIREREERREMDRAIRERTRR